jgi:hypothetical protein
VCGRVDHANLVRTGLGKPNITVRALDNPIRLGTWRDRRKQGNLVIGRIDFPDLARVVRREPDVSIRPGCDSLDFWVADREQGNFGDETGGRVDDSEQNQ